MPGRRGNKGGTGGYQQPSTPAAVSGPGASSARTDGLTPRVDLTGADAEYHGQRSELETMASQTGGGGGGPAASPAAASPSADPSVDPQMGLNMDVFRASDYPDMPTLPSSPAYDLAAQAVPDDPDALLHAMYEMTGHPDVLRLMSMRRGAL